MDTLYRKAMPKCARLLEWCAILMHTRYMGAIMKNYYLLSPLADYVYENQWNRKNSPEFTYGCILILE